MRLKNFLSSICAASLVALSFVACQDYDNGYTEQQINFIRDFKAIYGEVDATQDWNLAERATVTVTTSKPSDIKIYAKTNGFYSLVGHYSDVSGTQTLGIDVIEGTTEIMVSNGSTAQYTTVGNSVTFNSASTRGIIESNHVKKEGGYRTMGSDTYGAWTTYLPEGKNNSKKEVNNFTYVSTGEFTLYPIYWNTSNADEVYIYYYDESDLHDDIDISDDVLNGIAQRHNIHIYTIKDAGDELQYITDENEWKNAEEGNEPYNLEDNPSLIRTKGIKINFKAGTVFGMYIKTSEGNRFYSNSALNTDKAVHACTFKDNDRLYLGFDSDSDYDLNDCMFMIEGSLPAITIEEGSSWIISVEDLGNTLDIDYNDVVIEVQYTSGEEYAYVTPLAAGGTLASYVYFTGEGNREIPIGEGEIHQLFGAEKTVSGYYTPINVDNDKARPTKYASTYPIKVGSQFTLAESQIDNTNYNGNTASTMGGFKIKVLQRDQTNFNANKVQTIQNTTTKGDDNVPYVICTPKIWGNQDWKKKGHYRWPRESVPMLSLAGYGIAAYGTEKHSFAEWVANKSNAKDWFAYPYRDEDNESDTYSNTCAPGIVEDSGMFSNFSKPTIDLEEDIWDGWIDEF